MQITEEILNKNGYYVQVASFPFDTVPLYENHDNDVYLIDMGDEFNPRWLFGLSSDSSSEAEGDTIEDFNEYLISINKEPLILS